MNLSTPLHMSSRLRILLTIVAVLFGIQYLLIPLTQWQQRTVNRAADLRESLARKQMLTGSDTKLNSVYLQDREFRDKLRARFPAGSPEPQDLQLALQQQVETWAGRFGIRVLKVDWLPIDTAQIVRAPVRFNLEAAPDDLMQLLYTLESAPLLNTVEGVSLSASGDRSPFLKAMLDVCAYGIARETKG